MIESNYKNSLLIKSQIPEHIRDNPDYSNFVLFIQAYYEWLEQNNGVADHTKNLLNYKDVDNSPDAFVEYFTSDFLPNFPKDILANRSEVTKLARQLYQTKGTPSSYQFLFRTLYDSDFDYLNTKDVVLRASDGVWYVAKSLKLGSDDRNFLETANYRIFGETTKSMATIEAATMAGNKIELFITDIQRLFESGEFVRVVDTNNQDVLFDGEPLRAKVVGQINQITINPNSRGLLYQVGDPVIVYGGLNSANGVGAVAEVGTTTKGSIQRINIKTEGLGYTASPQTTINFVDAPGAEAIVGSFNPDPKLRANVAHIPIDSIALKRFIRLDATDYHFDGAVANANVTTTLADAFSFTGFSTYPISSVLVTNGGGGITRIPKAAALSTYEQDDENLSDLSALGILGPIQITSGGLGYQLHDTIELLNGSGVGAEANVTGVAANGMITSIGYVPLDYYPLGGMGYRNEALPTPNVVSANAQAYGAELYVPGILGTGASFSIIVDRAGSVSTIKLVNPGEDYTSTPNVSMKVQDIVVTGISVLNPPRKGDVVYQGTDITLSSYNATVNSYSLLVPNQDPTLSLYSLRVFDYNSNPNSHLPLKIDGIGNITMANVAYDSTYNEFGYKNFGDGSAKASASFLNGLAISQGQYLSSQGQPSSYNILQSENFNNFTYQITVEKEISKYREVLTNMLHPSGMKLIGRNSLKANTEFAHEISQALSTGHTLQYHTGYAGSNASMSTDFTTWATNELVFENLAGADMAGFVNVGTVIEIQPENGYSVKSTVKDFVNSDTVLLDDYVILTYANVAYATAEAGSNTINITSVTNAYDIINNGNYSNTAYPLKDIVYAGDKVLVDNNTSKIVSSVDYENGVIYLTTNLSANANSFLSVNRTLDTRNVRIFGLSGIQYVPQLATEDGQIITTEDDRIILLG